MLRCLDQPGSMHTTISNRFVWRMQSMKQCTPAISRFKSILTRVRFRCHTSGSHRRSLQKLHREIEHTRVRAHHAQCLEHEVRVANGFLWHETLACRWDAVSMVVSVMLSEVCEWFLVNFFYSHSSRWLRLYHSRSEHESRTTQSSRQYNSVHKLYMEVAIGRLRQTFRRHTSNALLCG